ncbi:MAG: hypothetical protein ACKPJD_25010, partial [Planctomycetaceae bacterium]
RPQLIHCLLPPGETAATEPLKWLKEQPCGTWAIVHVGSRGPWHPANPRDVARSRCRGVGGGVGRWGFTQSHRAWGGACPRAGTGGHVSS